MASIDTTSTGQACSVCGTQMERGEERCSSCGATHDKRHACPFCRVVTEPRPHPELRYSCPACGAPRVPAVSGLTSSKTLTSALRTARSARCSRAVWRVTAGLSGTFGAFAILLLLGISLIASPGALPLLAAGVVTAMPLLFAILALMQAKKRNQQIQSSLDTAWIDAAKQLTATKGTVRTGEIAETFGIEVDQARMLVAHLGALEDLKTSVTDDGDIALSMRSPLLRVETPPVREPQATPQEVEVESPVQDQASFRER